MKIIQWDHLHSPETHSLIESLCEGKKGSALTIGGFDGPHSGHEKLFDAVQRESIEHNLASGIVTFTRSPGVSKKGQHYPGDVSTLHLRLGYFAKKHFDFVLLIDFSGNFGKMSGGVFFDILVNTVHMRYVAVGPDFRCGHRLDTGIAEISAIARKEGFRFDSIQQIELDGHRISSSAVRQAIQSADFVHVERLLGHSFLLDLSIPNWKSGRMGREVPTGSFTQILPRCGEYTVFLVLDTGTYVKAKLRITDEKVILFPLEGEELPDAKEYAAVKFRLS